MPYEHPFFKDKLYHIPRSCESPDHTMGNSLDRYCDIKVHSLLKSENIKTVNVIGKFDRSSNISQIEKKGKRFNYMRPTVRIDGDIAFLECYPGQDYIVQFADVLETYFAQHKLHIQVNAIYPSEETCWNELKSSGILTLPKARNVIFGYVENFNSLSDQTDWNGSSYFKWKKCKEIYGDTILVGCEHTYWGDIAGRMVSYLAEAGTQLIIYSGKLGSLNPLHIPNKSIATGNRSVLPGYGIVEWNNLFETVDNSHIYHGTHMTMPSVLQETKEWLSEYSPNIDFVDPEIGHMALASQLHGIQFSYLHLISDNLSHKYDSDLSNERKESVLEDRKNLYNIIQNTIKETLQKQAALQKVH